MASTTDNFNLPLYDTGDPANLRDQYNSAMGIIDGEMKTAIDNTTTALGAADEAKAAAAQAKTAATTAQSTADDAVGRLNALGATNNTAARQLKAKIDATSTGLNAVKSDFSSFKATTNAGIGALQTKDTEIERDLSATTTKANTNESNISKITANLNALHANSPTDAGNLYNDIQDMKNFNHLVIIGDSFSTDNRTQVWWKQLPDYCKNLVAHNYSAGGVGFVQGTDTFTKQLDKAIADGTFDNDRVSHVIIYGGYNDWAYGHSSDDVKEVVRSTYTKAVKNFPKANVMLCFGNIGFANGKDKYDTWKAWVKGVQSSLYTNGVPFAQSDLWLCGYTPTVFEGDELHPNEIGQGIICAHMAAMIMGWQTSGERLIAQRGDSSTMNYVEMWYNDLTGIVSLYGKQSPTDLAGTGQQKLLDIGGYPPLIGNESNPLFGCGWYMSGAQADKVRSVCFSPVNKGVYVNISEAFTDPSKLTVYFNCHYHV